MATPHQPHWEAILQIVKYLEAHPGHELLNKANVHLGVEAFADSNWTGSLSNDQLLDIAPF